jgi:hypothetical protein
VGLQRRRFNGNGIDREVRGGQGATAREQALNLGASWGWTAWARGAVGLLRAGTEGGPVASVPKGQTPGFWCCQGPTKCAKCGVGRGMNPSFSSESRKGDRPDARLLNCSYSGLAQASGIRISTPPHPFPSRLTEYCITASLMAALDQESNPRRGWPQTCLAHHLRADRRSLMRIACIQPCFTETLARAIGCRVLLQASR